MVVGTHRTYYPVVLASGLAGLLLITLWQLTALGHAPAPANHLLAIYALAFDNDPDYPAASLAAAYTPTIQGIVSATLAAPDKTAVILADRDGYGDTRLLIARNGVITDVVPWPAALQQLAPGGVRELDLASGNTLGTLIQWARQTYPAEATLFSFVGHGAPLAPEPRTPVENPTPAPTPGAVQVPTPPLKPLPSRWPAHVGLTDFHSGSLLSLRDLEEALRLGTANGAQPLTLLDLLHCFSSSIEELYQVYPYAEMVAAAPNYAYSQPTMLGLALAALQPAMPPQQMAALLVQSYDEALPVEGHPRLLVAVESQKIAPIKTAWDQTSYHLYQALVADPPGVKTKIRAAYANSAKYDTTACRQEEWELAAPDALSDMANFAQRLSGEFGSDSPVGAWAITTTQRISAALVSRVAHSGVPWFAENGPAPWQLEAPGIALFTDFAPELYAGLPLFSWQAPWYKSYPLTTTMLTNPPGSGDEPLSNFLVGGYQGINWADVFQTFWQGASFAATNCQPSFLDSRGPGELRLLALEASAVVSVAALRLYQPLWLTATVASAHPATNPLVRFSIYRGDTLVYADVLSAGYLTAQQTRRIGVRQPWYPVQGGEYRLIAEVDIDERFVEPNEMDNRQSVLATVNPPVQVFMPLVRLQ